MSLVQTSINVRDNRRGNQELTIQRDTGNIGYTRHRTNKR